jgi:hypothetical protein
MNRAPLAVVVATVAARSSRGRQYSRKKERTGPLVFQPQGDLNSPTHTEPDSPDSPDSTPCISLGADEKLGRAGYAFICPRGRRFPASAALCLV